MAWWRSPAGGISRVRTPVHATVGFHFVYMYSSCYNQSTNVNNTVLHELVTISCTSILNISQVAMYTDAPISLYFAFDFGWCSNCFNLNWTEQSKAVSGFENARMDSADSSSSIMLRWPRGGLSGRRGQKQLRLHCCLAFAASFLFT